MTEQFWNANSIALLSAVISCLGSIGGALLAVRYAFRRLEKDELRKAQVSLLIELYGSRFVMSMDQLWDNESRSRFHLQINKVGVLFVNHQAVLRALRQFRSTTQPTDFANLIQEMGFAIGINRDILTLDDIQTVVTLKAPSQNQP